MTNMDTQTAQLLVVDDDVGLRELLERYLGEQGYQVSTVEDGAAMDEFLTHNQPDLIILDLMLPGEDGLSIASRLHSNSDIPIIILSARGEEVDRIVGLEIGADDYLPKPFNPRELLARIRSVLRRHSVTPEQAQADNTSSYQFGPFILNLDNRTLYRDDTAIDLTSGDYDLLVAMTEHPNRVLSRDTLVDLLKGYDRSPFDRSVDVRVTRLRRKIENDPANPVYIRTVWGAGYMFTPEGDQHKK